MLELLIYLGLVIVILPFFAYALSGLDLFWTRVQGGDIKFIVRGESPWRIIYDVRGFVLSSAGQFESSITQPERHWLDFPSIGIYWIGIPPFLSIHSFLITKEKENPAGKGPEDWITEGGEEMVSSLRFAFPRPFVLRAVELKDRQSVDLLLVAKMEIVDPYLPVFQLKGKFFELAGSIIRASVNDVLKGFDLDEFIKADKGESGILKSLKDSSGPLNTELIGQVGPRLVAVSVAQYNPSDETIKQAMQAEAVAKAKAKGVMAEAEGQAAAQERLAKARGARIRETVAELAKSGASGDVLARAVADALRAESLAGPESKLTTLVDGAGAPPVLPVGGGQKPPEKGDDKK